MNTYTPDQLQYIAERMNNISVSVNTYALFNLREEKMSHISKIMSSSSLAAALLFSVSAQAQDFPEHEITIVVPFAAGTTTDQTTRILAEAMEEDLNETVVVENRAGAGGSVGTKQVVDAEPDGYTISMGTVGTLAINKSLYPNLPYDPEEDVTPISFVGYTPTLLVVSADSEFQTLDDLIETATATDEGGVTFASAGNGTSGHLAGELLRIESGGDVVHVPFNSGAEGLAAVLSEEVDFMFYHPVAALPSIEEGELRALGVSSAEGSAVVPDVPPIADTYEDFDLIAWFLMAGPKNMPENATKRIAEAVDVALESSAVEEQFSRNGIEPGSMELDELPTFISDEVEKWGGIVEASEAQVD